MKLKNKKTGKIAEAIDLVAAAEIWGTMKTPSEIFEDWEFYEEEPEEHWCINEDNEPQRVVFSEYIEDIDNLEEIGLLFKTKEEAERAIQKLKAYKQLKDKGLKVKAFDYCMPYLDELNLLFGEMKKNK